MSHDYAVVSVVKIVDADTADVDIDLGFYLTTRQRLRILGVDAPERGRPGAAEATKFTAAWLTNAMLNGRLRVTTHKADSFGRWLADCRDDTTGEHLHQRLLDEGHAVPYARALPKENLHDRA